MNTPSTPLPWRIATEIGPSVISTCGSGDYLDPTNYREVCECYQDGEAINEANVQDAEFICRAANHYAELVDALREADTPQGRQLLAKLGETEEVTA